MRTSKQERLDSLLSESIIVIILAWLLLYGFCRDARAQIAEETAVRCVMGEARGEGTRGMQAVGEVLRRRGTTRGMFGCRTEFREPDRVWSAAREAWQRSAESDLTSGATHFESVDFKKPSWAAGMTETTRIGKHVFYREKQA